MNFLKKLKPIIFDFRYEDESGYEPYQLVVSRDVNLTGNKVLFLQFYQLLETLIQKGRENIYFYDLAPALEYHYWKFLPRFAFVNELADQYEQAEKTGQLIFPLINAYLQYWLEQKGTNSAIYEGTIRLPALVNEEMALRQGIPVGTSYTYIPEPADDLEAFQRLKFLMAPQVCEYHIREFGQKYKEPTAEIYASELAPINSFIKEIDYNVLKNAFERHDNDHAREYLRITEGYYNNHRCEQAMGNTTSIVYGKYILYKKWLENRLRESFSNKKARGLPQLIPSKVSSNFILGQELFNVLYQRGLLSDFFLVPAPPVKGRFWYDINDRDTDDPAKVVRVSPVSISQTRRAKIEDFQAVLDQVNIIGDRNSKAYQHFLDDLISCIEQMIGYHRTLHKPEEREENHYQMIELAEGFIVWLKSDKAIVLLAANQQVEKKQFVDSLEDISSEYTLEYYTNEEVIANQNLVNETINFYESGQGKGILTALEMLNLINKQQNFVMINYNNSEVVVQHLKNLPLTDRTKHSLLGFILKWFGGYPVNNLNRELNTTLKLIQKEFLSFKDDTPEKQYCKANQIMRNKLEKYGIALTTAINHGIDVGELLGAMEIEEHRPIIFHNFSDLFTAAIKAGYIENFTDRKALLIAQTAYNYQFNLWLQEYKNWEYRDEEHYQELLTTNIFKDFLNYKKDKIIVSIERPLNETTPPSNQTIKPKLSIRQVALICHYTDCAVTRATATSIVEHYGHTSGDSLFNDYTYYRSKANRLGAENTKKKNANKLKLFECVNEYLCSNEAENNKITDDLIILREAIENANLTL